MLRARKERISEILFGLYLLHITYIVIHFKVDLNRNIHKYRNIQNVHNHFFKDNTGHGDHFNSLFRALSFCLQTGKHAMRKSLIIRQNRNKKMSFAIKKISKGIYKLQ